MNYIVNKEGNKEVFIHYAAQFGNFVIVKEIVERGGANSVNLATSQGIISLHLAALEGDAELVDYLIRKGADIKYEDCKGFTVFHYAAQSDSEDAEKILKDLLSRNDTMGRDKLDLIKLRTKDNSTLLHWAVIFNNDILFEYILKYAVQKREGLN
jgi:ankyrin repeat protein